MGIKSIALVASTLLLSTTINAATTIDFEESLFDDHIYNESYTSKDFLFEGFNTDGSLRSVRIWDKTGSKGILNTALNGAIKMTQTNGQTFSVQSLDISASTIKNVTFTGVFFSGFAISKTISTLGNSYESIHATFSGFDDLVSLTWNKGSNNVDNIAVIASAVPVPAAAWLFGSGLIGLIGIARKSKYIVHL